MRIAINTRFLLPGRLEGLGGYTHEVARRLIALRPADEFIFLFDRPFDQQFIYGNRVQGVVVRPPARHPVLWWWWFEHRLPAVLRRVRADVLLSPDGYCSLRAGTPTIMVTHDLAHRHYPTQIPRLVRAYYNYFVPRYLRRAERIVTVSEYTRQDIQRQYGIPAAKISVAGNGIREHFRPLTAEESTQVRQRYTDGEPYFFFLGAVHPRKNLSRLLAAYDQFRSHTDSTVRLLIGGRMAWQTSDIRRAWEQARFRDDIHFLGYVPDEELPRLVGAARALTYVSLFEGFGVPVLEAMQCDTPVLTSNVSSLPEVAGEAALLVDPTDVDAIARGLEQLHTNEALRQQLIEKGRMQRQRYSWEQTARHISGLIEEMAGRRDKG
jgi:glycosyltransferase involved in cell wall biosynthesis